MRIPIPSRQQIFLVSVYLFVFFIPVYQDISIRLMLVAILLSLVLIKKDRFWTSWLIQGWDLMLYFLVLVVGLTYSDDLASGWSAIEKNLSFVVLPLVFSRMQKDESNKLFKIFSAGVIVASLICLGHAYWRFRQTGIADVFYYNELTSVIDAQPTYLAYYISFALIFLLYIVFYEGNEWRKQVLVICGVLFLACMLMLTAGRTTFISMLLVFAFFSLKLLFEPYPIHFKLKGLVLGMLLIVIVLFQSPYAQRILPQVLAGTHTLDKIKGDSWNRLVLWQSALDATTSLWWGVGTGDDTQVINDYYRTHGYTEFADLNFNAHNQFIQNIFCQGIIGLIALMLMLGRPLYISVSRQHIFGILTFFPFLIYGITEVFLGRYQGIVFFVLLHQIFIRHYNNQSSQSGTTGT